METHLTMIDFMMLASRPGCRRWPARPGRPLALPQRLQKVRQAVVVNLLHQGQQTADFTRRKAFSGKPVQVIPRQIGNQRALVLAEWHCPGNQQE